MNASASPREFWRARLNIPNYELREAARYAHIHTSTVSRWHKNTTLREKADRTKLSYLQLIELAMVASWKEAGMKLSDIRAARAYFAGAFKTDHPFATLKLVTDGVDLAMKAGAAPLLGNKAGQLAWNEIIGARFKEFDYEAGLVTRWHVGGVESPVLIDPRISFGAPQVSGVPTWLLRDRWTAGEPLDEITDDLSLKPEHVLAALRFEGVEPDAKRTSEWLN